MPSLVILSNFGLYTGQLTVCGVVGQGSVFKHYMLCELSGCSINSRSDDTTCSKDELETYNYVGLSVTSSIFTFIFLPLLFLLVMIEWRRFIRWMKVSFQMKKQQL